MPEAYKILTAKYTSTCTLCSKPITPGQQIRYAKGQPSSHASCAPVAIPADAIHLSVGQGYASPQFSGWTQGNVIHNTGRKQGSSAAKASRERQRLAQEWEKAHPEERMPDGPPETYTARYHVWAQGMTERWKARKATRDTALDEAMGTLAEDDGPEYLYVLTASRRYYREDGMSFGVGDESGYVYSATCRPATEEEAQPLREQLAAATRRRHADTLGGDYG